MKIENIKENQVFLKGSYYWRAKLKNDVLMLFSNTDGFNRWCEITQENIKGFTTNLNIKAI